MPGKSFTCPACGKKNTVAAIIANDYACLNSRCALRDRLLVHGEIGINGKVKQNYGWVLESGTVLNQRYTIEKLLGKGGFGATYLAKDRKMFNQVRAIKEVPNLFFDEKEEEFLTILNHPLIPKLIERFNVNLLHYSVMEYAEGQGLDELVKASKGGIPEKQALQLTTLICDVLAYIHSQKIIHRDLKPENILVTRQNSIALIDFGIAKEFNIGQGTRRLARAASSFYSSPEQYQAGKGYTDVKSDIYSLGAILYYLLTGQEPVDALSRNPTGDISPLPGKLNPKISPLMEKVIVKAMKMRKQDRFSSIKQMQKMLLGGKTLPAGVCSKCGSAIKAPGNYCANCGHATNQLSQPPIEPFIFRSGENAMSIQQLIQLCYKRWEDAKWHLRRGDFTSWLMKQGEKNLARKAKQLKKRKTDPDILLNEFLTTSKFGVPPSISFYPEIINLKPLPKGVRKELTLSLGNTGKGILKGKVKTSASWLNISVKEFSCHGGKKFDSILTIDTTSLTNLKNYSEKIIIESNAGLLEIPVTLRIKPQPARVQLTPQKIISQIKPGNSALVNIQVKNIGNDEALAWQFTPTEHWIKVSPVKFKARVKSVQVEISARRLKEGKYSGTIQVRTLTGKYLIRVELLVTRAAKSRQTAGKNQYQLFQRIAQPILISFFIAMLIHYFGEPAQPAWTPLRVVIFFTAAGGLWGLRRSISGFLVGLLFGTIFGYFSQFLVYYLFMIFNNHLAQPIRAFVALQNTPRLILTSWGVIGIVLGGIFGLIRELIEMRQVKLGFLAWFACYTFLFSLLFIGLAYLY